MKIVVNRCFGGFGLSGAAQVEYLKRTTGQPLFAYRQTKYDFRDGVDEYKRVPIPSRKREIGGPTIHYLTKDAGPSIKKIPKDGYFYPDWERDDKVLVSIVEEMGEKAWGDFAELEVVEIPDGVDWEIDEYDGSERIRERSREW